MPGDRDASGHDPAAARDRVAADDRCRRSAAGCCHRLDSLARACLALGGRNLLVLVSLSAADAVGLAGMGGTGSSAEGHDAGGNGDGQSHGSNSVMVRNGNAVRRLVVSLNRAHQGRKPSKIIWSACRAARRFGHPACAPSRSAVAGRARCARQPRHRRRQVRHPIGQELQPRCEGLQHELCAGPGRETAFAACGPAASDEPAQQRRVRRREVP